MTTKIIAHRGASKYAPENTMSAFKLAYEMDADGIELDVQLTKDLVPVIIHDESVKRTTGVKRYINDLTIKEVKQLDAGKWFSQKFREEQIPTLEEVLEWIAPTGMLLNIELKNNINPYEGMEDIIIKLVNKYDMQEKVIYSSFNHYSLKEIIKLAPHADVAILYGEKLYKPWKYIEFVGAKSAHPNYKNVTDETIAGFKKHGVEVRPYTVNNSAKMSYFFKNEIDAIITDVPDVAKSIREESGSPVITIGKKVINKFRK